MKFSNRKVFSPSFPTSSERSVQANLQSGATACPKLMPISSTSKVASEDSSLDLADIFSALKAVSEMVLPLGLPQAATLASQLLTTLEDERRNNAGVRELIVDISKIILALVEPIRANATGTTREEKHVAEVISYLTTLRRFCEDYLSKNWFYKFLFSSAWKQNIEDVHKRVHVQLMFLNTTTNRQILAEIISCRQPMTPPDGTSRDKAFQNAEIGDSCRIYNGAQIGLNQALPIPDFQPSSEAFAGAKIKGNANIMNHTLDFR